MNYIYRFMISILNDTNRALDKNNDVIMSYSANDWFYLAVENSTNINDDMPTYADCSENSPYDQKWDTNCNETNLEKNQYGCMVRALCMNREKSQELEELENKNSDVDTKYNDDYHIYYNTMANTANLGIGLAVLFGVIYNTVYSNI